LDRPLANALSGIARVLNKAGRRLLLAICDKPFIQRREYVSLFKERSLDGMIIWGAKREELFWNELAGRNVVMANSRSLSNPFPYVGTDNAKAARECCELMIARGRERILYLDCCASVSIADERFAGYREAHAKAGRPFDPGLVVRSDDLRFCVERAVALKKADPRAFDAVHCVNEALAIFLGIELERLGLSIPSDVALIGGDRLEDRYSPAFNMRFPILSFQPDCVRLGELAAQALLPEEGTPPAAETLLPAKILDCE
jgi:LacI family transcriptional regulator